MKYTLPLLFLFILTACQNKTSESRTTNSFTFEIETKLKGNANLVYEQLTGDISPWWDHTFSGNPYQLYIEAKPGGGF